MLHRRIRFLGTSLTVSAAVLALVTGCGSEDDAENNTAEQSAAAESPALTPPASGPMLTECGSVSDDEVVEALGVGPFTDVTRSGVGCEWTVSGLLGPSVTFSWYRGSPIGRERAGSELIGRPAADITIGGYPGFIASRESVLCELGISFGDDFVHWSVNYGLDPGPVDPCTVGRNLMELTVSRAQ